MAKSAFLPGLCALALLSACGGGGAANNTSSNTETEAFNQGDAVYCPAVEQRVTAQDCEDLTREDAQVQSGAAAFNVPDPMRRGQTVEVHLVIDRRAATLIRRIDGAMPIDPAPGNDMNTTGDMPDSNSTTGSESGTELQTNSALPQGDEPAPTPGAIVERLEGTPERFYPPVGRHMRAELVGQGFDIVPRTEASQEIPLGGQASWIWEVTAREGGTKSLSLITVVEGMANGRRFVLARTPKVRTVTVEVDLRDRIWDALVAAPNWIKALTAVIVALGGLLTAWYGLPWWKRRRSQPGDAPDDKASADKEE